ncbi:MAG: carbon-nitrogen hydrolase family protein [Gammaproteobacteria bacterium]|nr:carbon-nitrogen hydrolase family protein [Gammaproteobacteria bacterium]
MTRIALAQTNSTDDFDHNLSVALKLVQEAAAAGAALLAFPEVFLLIGSKQKKLEHALTLDDPIVLRFQELAVRHGIFILLGSVHERIAGNAERVHNTSVLLDDRGEQIAVYRKQKLFDVDLETVSIKESDSIVPGAAPCPVVQTRLGRIGLSICFDLRFPELYRALRRQDAEIVFAPSNFSAPTGRAHWETLLRARAIENQFYMVAPAQVGEHNGQFQSHGHSMLVDAWGSVISVHPGGPGLSYGELDLDSLYKVRRELPVGPELW